MSGRESGQNCTHTPQNSAAGVMPRSPSPPLASLKASNLNFLLPAALTIAEQISQTNKLVRTMRIAPIVVRLLLSSAAIAITIGMTPLAPRVPALGAAQAAQSSDAGSGATTVTAEAADQTGLKQGTTAIETNSPADGSKQRLVTAKLEGCKSQFKLADLNGDGVVDAGEIAHYNSSIRSEKQPALPDGDRFNEAGFIAACSSASAHE
jgi:hypothetical protein